MNPPSTRNPNPKPHTLFPKPHTAHPDPYTLKGRESSGRAARQARQQDARSSAAAPGTDAPRPPGMYYFLFLLEFIVLGFVIAKP